MGPRHNSMGRSRSTAAAAAAAATSSAGPIRKSADSIAKSTASGARRRSPIVRMVRIFAPRHVTTDPENFLAIVQKFTGNGQAPPPPPSLQPEPRLQPSPSPSSPSSSPSSKHLTPAPPPSNGAIIGGRASSPTTMPSSPHPSPCLSTNANAATLAPPLLMLPPSPISPMFLASRPRIIYDDDDDDDDDDGCRSPLFDHGYPGSPPPSGLPIVGAAAHDRPISDNAHDGALFGGDFDSAVYSWMQLPIV